MDRLGKGKIVWHFESLAVRHDAVINKELLGSFAGCMNVDFGVRPS